MQNRQAGGEVSGDPEIDTLLRSFQTWLPTQKYRPYASKKRAKTRKNESHQMYAEG